MSILHVTKDNFEELVLKSKIPVFVDFYTNWCGDCKRITPLLDIIAQKRVNSLVIAKVDCEVETELKEQWAIMAYPTLYIFKNGTHGESLIEPNSIAQIDTWIDSQI